MGMVAERVTVSQIPYLVRFDWASLELTNRTDQAHKACCLLILGVVNRYAAEGSQRGAVSILTPAAPL